MKTEKSIETPRLRLRAYQKGDRDFCLSLWCDEENGKYMSDPRSENISERYLSCFDGMEDDPEGYYLIAVHKENGERIGTCCVFEEGGNRDIGYCVAKMHWRRGFGSEMIAGLLDWVKEKGANSLSAEVADENAASVALLKKFGFCAAEKTRFKKWGEETYFDAHVYRLSLDVEGAAGERSQ